MLKTRQLGGEGVELRELSLGCMGMTYAYGAADERDSVETVERAIELGRTFFDTAEVYGPYTNEELPGGVVAGHRDQMTIAAKLGGEVENRASGGLNSRPEHIREQSGKSRSVVFRWACNRLTARRRHLLRRQLPPRLGLGGSGLWLRQAARPRPPARRPHPRARLNPGALASLAGQQALRPQRPGRSQGDRPATSRLTQAVSRP